MVQSAAALAYDPNAEQDDGRLDDLDGLTVLDEPDWDDDGEPDWDGDDASHVRVPEVGDRRWFQWTRPLYAFLLDSDRAWPELLQWGRDNRVTGEMLRHQLAALDYMGDALTVGVEKALRWRAVGYPSRPGRTAA